MQGGNEAQVLFYFHSGKTTTVWMVNTLAVFSLNNMFLFLISLPNTQGTSVTTKLKELVNSIIPVFWSGCYTHDALFSY